MRVTYIERSPGTWRLRIERGRDVEGKRLFSYETVRGTKDDAARRRFELLQADEEGTFAKPDKLRLGAYFERWVAQQLALQKITRNSAENYQLMFRTYAAQALGGVALQKVTVGQIQGLYTNLLTQPRASGRKLSVSSVLHLHRILATLFRAARRMKLLKVNPMDEVEPPRKPKPKPKALDGAGVAAVLNALAGTWREPIAFVGFMTGLRRGELLGLRWQDIDLAGARLHVRGQIVQYADGSLEWRAPKTENAVRSISIAPELVDMLRRLRVGAAERRMRAGLGGGLDDAYVFTLDGTNPIRPDVVSHGFNKVCDELGLPGFTFHGMRHTHLTELLRRVGKAGAKAVSERAGHADISTTLSIYQRVFESDDRELAELSRGLIGKR
jgi:integrase